MPCIKCMLLLLQLFFTCFRMVGSNRAYAESPIMFSPEGRILQLEAASAAVEKGSLILVVTTKGCQDVLLFFAKKKEMASKLQITSRNQLYHIDESRKDVELLLCATGWIPDAGPVERLTELICLDYLEKFNMAIPSGILASSLGISIHDALKKGARPLGASFLLVGVDVDYGIDGIKSYIGVHSLLPDGSSEHLYAGAIGSKSEELVETLSSFYDNDECVDIKKAWGIIKTCVFDEFNVPILSSQMKSISDNEMIDIENDYIFEAMEGRLVDLRGKLSWTMYDHNQVLDLINKA